MLPGSALPVIVLPSAEIFKFVGAAGGVVSVGGGVGFGSP